MSLCGSLTAFEGQVLKKKNDFLHLRNEKKISHFNFGNKGLEIVAYPIPADKKIGTYFIRCFN